MELPAPWRVQAGHSAGLLFAPYRRLVALHLTIIFCAIAVMVTGAPVAAVAILVGIKTLLDLGLHLAEHRAATPAGARPRELRAAVGVSRH